jgi:hypothetical protein
LVFYSSLLPENRVKKWILGMVLLVVSKGVAFLGATSWRKNFRGGRVCAGAACDMLKGFFDAGTYIEGPCKDTASL